MQLSIHEFINEQIAQEQENSTCRTAKPLQEIDYLCQPLPAQLLTWEQQRLSTIQKYQQRHAQELKKEAQDIERANFVKGLLG